MSADRDWHPVGFSQTVKWDGDQVIEILAFWDTALQAQQVGLA